MKVVLPPNLGDDFFGINLNLLTVHLVLERSSNNKALYLYQFSPSARDQSPLI